MTDYTQKAERDKLDGPIVRDGLERRPQMALSLLYKMKDACDTLEARAEAAEAHVRNHHLEPCMSCAVMESATLPVHRPDCVAGEGQTHWYACEERIAALEARAAAMSEESMGLQEILDGARRERDENEELLNLLRPILDGVTAALKGPPEPLRLRTWHDLPKLAAEKMERIAALEKALEDIADNYICGTNCPHPTALACTQATARAALEAKP